MKRLLIILTLIIVLGVSIMGCGNSNKNDKLNSNNTTTENSNSNENKEKVQLEAVKANYNDVINGKYNDKIIWVEGEVILIKDGSFPDFDLKVKDNNEFVTYKILNAESLEGLKQGDKVKVYGTVTDAKNPIIEASTIDKE
ncbi:OB-fold protein [Clostridium tarantellae]|nr:hypothetical protein [Clostridium tarantellae]